MTDFHVRLCQRHWPFDILEQRCASGEQSQQADHGKIAGSPLHVYLRPAAPAVLSMNFAKAISKGDTPPASCVVSTTLTVL